VIFGEVDDGVLAGDVGGGDDGELVPGDVRGELDAGDAAAGDGGAHGCSEPHVGEGDVVHILGAAEDLGAAFLAEGRAAYGLEWFGHWVVDDDRTKVVLRLRRTRR